MNLNLETSDGNPNLSCFQQRFKGSIRTGTPSLPSENRALHGSMENVHRPTNFRTNLPTPINVLPSQTALVVSGNEGKSHSALKKEISKEEVENGSLYKYIGEQKRAILLRKVVMKFQNGALKKYSEKIAQLELERQSRSEESAARLILHSLLLNCWRKDKLQLGTLTHENAQLTISVENLGLQLRVLRHLQAQDKDNANTKVLEIRTLKSQLSSAQKTLKNAECDLSNAQEELRFTREDNEKLVDQKSFLQKELSQFLELKEGMTTALELEKKRASRAEEECRVTKEEYSELRKNIKDLTAQSSRWKERARDLESKGMRITAEIHSRDKSLHELESNFKDLLAELEQCKSKKIAMREAYEASRENLKGEIEKSTYLKENLETILEIVASQVQKLIHLEQMCLKLRTENKEIETELYRYKLRNVRKRRAWVNAIDAIFSPASLFKYMIFGLEPKETHG